MEKINLSQEQQKQTADYLSIDISEKSIDEAQVLIDSEMGKSFDAKVVEVINVSEIGKFNKFVIAKFPIEYQRYLIMGVGRNRNARGTSDIGHIKILDKLADTTINPIIEEAKPHIGESKDLVPGRDIHPHELAPFEISGGIIEVDKEKRIARVFGMSKGYGEYTYEDIALVRDELKKVLDVDQINIESSRDYQDKEVQDL